MAIRTNRARRTSCDSATDSVRPRASRRNRRTRLLGRPSNREALAWLDRWPAWPGFAVALAGPPGCGKSHLAHMFQVRTGGVRVEGAALTGASVPDLGAHPSVVVEDADRGVDETALFHLYNVLQDAGHGLLLTGREPPARWTVQLADLRSRLATVPVAAIGAPDDALLSAVLLKLFADRQLRIGPDVPAYLIARMERSFAGAHALVAEIDRRALATGRPVTIALLRDIFS